MTWTPHSMLPKPPCATCSTTAYTAPEHGDCIRTTGKIFCSDWCRRTMRVRLTHGYLIPKVGDQRRKKCAVSGVVKK